MIPAIAIVLAAAAQDTPATEETYYRQLRFGSTSVWDQLPPLPSWARGNGTDAAAAAEKPRLDAEPSELPQFDLDPEILHGGDPIPPAGTVLAVAVRPTPLKIPTRFGVYDNHLDAQFAGLHRGPITPRPT